MRNESWIEALEWVLDTFDMHIIGCDNINHIGMLKGENI